MWQLSLLLGSPPIDNNDIFCPTLVITKQSISGCAGCNEYAGFADIADGQFMIHNLRITMMYCRGIQQEELFLESLQEATHYQLIEDHLEMFNNQNKAILVFTKRQIHFLLATKEDWQLSRLNGQEVASNNSISFKIYKDRILGQINKGSFFVSQQSLIIEGNHFKILELITRKEVGKAEFNTQEDDFFLAFRSVETYQVRDNRLELQNHLGETTLIFDMRWSNRA